MSSSNRVQIASVLESTLGTTPTTPRMRANRFTSESLDFTPEFMDSDEIRSDRSLGDPIKIMQASKGGINGELSYPVDNSPLSTLIQSALAALWTNMPSRDNDGVADSVITDIQSGTQVVTVTTGAPFVTGQLVKFSGLAAAASNVVQKVTTGSATLPAFVGGTLVTDAAPAAAARMKVVGFQGASADITATATGLGSTALNFTLMGLTVGQWIKIGGTAAGDKFATAALNAYARITAIAATALTLDNLPVGWTTDAGTGKTIKVWVADIIKNGTTVYGQTFEKGFLDQAVPVYIVFYGEVCNTLEFNLASRQKVTYSATFMGMGGSESTVTLDAAPDAATTPLVMAGNANVGRVAEAGATLGSPNWAREFTLNINNNLRQIEAVDSTSPVDIQQGECTVTGRVNKYFGSESTLTQFFAGTASALNSRITKDGQTVILDVPRATYRGGGNPQVSGKNVDVTLPLDWQASYSTAFSCQVAISRMEFVES